MNDEKEVELAKETFLKLGWDIYDERDVEVLSEAFKSHGKSCYERGREEAVREAGMTPEQIATVFIKNQPVVNAVNEEITRLKERVAELERTRT